MLDAATHQLPYNWRQPQHNILCQGEKGEGSNNPGLVHERGAARDIPPTQKQQLSNSWRGHTWRGIAVLPPLFAMVSGYLFSRYPHMKADTQGEKITG